MAIYFDLWKDGNQSGQHVFDGAALALLGGYETVDKQTVPDGTLIKLQTADTKQVIADDILLHKDGRIGQKDEALDKLVIPIEKLAFMPDDIQTALAPFENVPGGKGRVDPKGEVK